MPLKDIFKGWGFKEWTQLITLIIAIVGALNSVFGFYKKEINKKHNLTIDIAGMSTSGKRVAYTIAFINEGDYPEIVADIDSYLGQRSQEPGGKEREGLAWYAQRDCFQPLVVGPGEHKVITYETEYNTDKDIMKMHGMLQEFVAMLLFQIRGPQQGLLRPRPRWRFTTLPISSS